MLLERSPGNSLERWSKIDHSDCLKFRCKPKPSLPVQHYYWKDGQLNKRPESWTQKDYRARKMNPQRLKGHKDGSRKMKKVAKMVISWIIVCGKLAFPESLLCG